MNDTNERPKKMSLHDRISMAVDSEVRFLDGIRRAREEQGDIDAVCRLTESIANIKGRMVAISMETSASMRNNIMAFMNLMKPRQKIQVADVEMPDDLPGRLRDKLKTGGGPPHENAEEPDDQ